MKNLQNITDQINNDELRFNDMEDVKKVKYYWTKYRSEIIENDNILNSFTYFIEGHNGHMGELNLKSMF